MKKALSVLFVFLFILSTLCACTEGKTKKNDIDDNLTGLWYGPSNNPVLNISKNGSGTVTYDSIEYIASFSANDEIFSASSDGYVINGEYTVDSYNLNVYVEYRGEIYTVIFTREEVVLPTELKGNHIYKKDDKAYEVIIDENGIICQGIPYPPSADYETEEIYITPELPKPDDTNTENDDRKGSGYIVNKKPPTEAFKPKEATAASSASTESTNSIKPTNVMSTETTENNTKPTEAVPEKKPATKKDFVPDIISVKDGNVSVELKGEKIPTGKGGGSIVGTWTSAPQEGTAYIFGYTTDLPYTVTYTFNADGTGTVTALFFTGTLTWSLSGNKLDITVSMLGDVDSGTAYVTLLGDTLYLENLDGKVYPMAKTN